LSYRIAAVVGAFATIAATALAAATPVTPPPGAVIGLSSPAFSWTLPADEQADALLIADKPDTTPAGTFPQASLVRAHALTSGETTWSPSAPLYAGRYWWLVASHDRSMTARYSTPSDFTISLSFEFDRSTVRRSLSRHWLRLTPHWRGNMRAVRVKVNVLLGRRILWTGTALRANRIGRRGSVTFTLHRPRNIAPGTALHVREGFTIPGEAAGGGDGFGVKAP
jgi:hypothetical protein